PPGSQETCRPTATRALSRVYRQGEGEAMGYRAIVRRLLWSAGLFLATQVYAQTEAPTFPNPGKTSMSRDQQHALGLEAAAQVFQQMPVLPDDSPESLYVR